MKRDGSLQALAIDVALAALVCWVAAAIYLSHYGVANALSSDNLSPYILYDDLFHRRLPLAGFYWPESPFYFPDLIVAWTLYALTGSLLAAVGAYAWVNSLVLVLLARAILFRSAAGSNATLRTAWLVFLCVWLLVCALGVRTGMSWFGQFHAYVFVPNNHSGALLGVMAALALLVGDKKRVGWSSLVTLLVLCAVMLISDRLFEIQFIVPAIAFCAWRRVATRCAWYGHAAVLLGVLLVAAESLRWLFPSATMQAVAELAGAQATFQIGGDPTMRVPLATSLGNMARDFLAVAGNDPITTAIEVTAFGAALWMLRRTARRGSETAGDEFAANRQLFAALLLAVAIAPFCASALLGRHIAIHAFRYCQTLVLLLLPLALLLTQLIDTRVRDPRRIAWVTIAVLALAALALPLLVDASRSALHAHESDQENCLRELVRADDLRFGVAEYWHALEMTARFRDTPVVAPLSDDAGPRMSMMTNVAWFGALAEDAAAIPVLGFVDEYSYAPQLLDQVYGKPFRTVACPRSSYRVYRPQDGALSRMYRHFDWLPGQLLRRMGRVMLPAAAWAADESYVDGDALVARGQLARRTPVLITAQDFPAGRLQLRLTYALTLNDPGASARWDVTALNAEGTPASALGADDLPVAPQLRQIDLPLAARPAGVDGIGISVQVSGAVDLRIAAIEIRIGK